MTPRHLLSWAVLFTLVLHARPHQVVIRLGQKGYMDRIERAVTNGEVLLLENIMENVDPVLEPLLGNYGINAKRPS